MKSDTAQPPEKSALDLGWEDQNGLCCPLVFLARFSFLFQKMSMWCRNMLKHALQAITCIQEDPVYGKYHGLEDSDESFVYLTVKLP
jgi:hypothetical protein